MKKVIITGAGGFVGSALTSKMISEGVEVIAISRDFCPKFPRSRFVKKINSEIDDSEKILKLIPDDEYDAFYHLAWRGVNGTEKSDPISQINNSKIALSCAYAAKKARCKKFLCAGTIAENIVKNLSNMYKTNGGMLYGVAKHCTYLMLDTYCKNLGQEYVWMQFSNIYGPGNKTGNLISYTLEKLSKGEEAEFGPAKQLYDFVYIDDLIEAIYRLGFHKTRKNRYFIGSGEPRLLKDYLTYIGERLEKPELIKIGVKRDDGIKYFSEMFDISDLKEDIGDYNHMSFEKGIEETIKSIEV